MASTKIAPPKALWLTDDPKACELIAKDPAALVIGFILDQQVTVQKAFDGPLQLKKRVGTIDPKKLAAMKLEKLEEAFAEKPAIHRFPSAMAARVRNCMEIVADEYSNDASRIWSEADDYKDLKKRLGALPGFGPGKIVTITSVLVRRYGFPFEGWDKNSPKWGYLGDVESPEDLHAYQKQKRAAKKAAREAAAVGK